jgi:heat shock protein HslJ
VTIRFSMTPAGVALIAGVLLGLLAGCAGAAPTPAPQPGEPATGAPRTEAPMLTGTLWAWQETVEGEDATKAADPSRYTITFLENGALGIQADCNRVRGQYSVDNDALTITLGPSTLMGCPPGSQADVFLAALGSTTAFSLDAGGLTLSTGSGAMRLVELPATAFVGTSWQVWGYNNGKNGVTTPVAGSQLTALFTAEGALSGSTGCNNFRGSYSVDGDNLAISPLAATKKACAPELMEQERQFLAALQSAASYSISANVLTIRDAGGARLVELRAGEA